MDFWNNKNKSQKGGIMINNKNSDEAFKYFMNNSTFSYLANGANGILFKAKLNAGAKSNYKTIEYTDSKSYGDMVNEIIIKLVFVYDDPKGETLSESIEIDINNVQSESESITPTEFYTTELQRFKAEVNIQTDVFFKTIEYLQPVCPAIVYSAVYEQDTDDEIDAYMEDKNNKTKLRWLLYTIYKSCDSEQTLNIINGITNLIYTNPTILNIGIIAMEFADSYTLLSGLQKKQTPKTSSMGYYDDYILTTNSTPQQTIRYENEAHQLDIDNELYINMTIFILLKLAYDTGYTHGDFHMSNIFINKNYNNYFKGIDGKPLLHRPKRKMRQSSHYFL